MKRILLSLMLCLVLVSLVSAEPSFIFEQDTEVDLKITCLDENNALCNDVTICTLTVNKPDMTNLVKNVSMTHNDNFYNYTLNTTQTETLGEHSATIICLGGGVDDGYTSFTYLITTNGLQLTEEQMSMHSSSIWFLIFLFVLAVIGIFTFPSPIGKWACYFTSHVLFIVGTFLMWQFNNDFAIGGLGATAGIFKVLFYVSITSLFPIVLLSIAWMFYYHTMNDTIKGFMDRGMDEDEAIRRARRKRKW